MTISEEDRPTEEEGHRDDGDDDRHLREEEEKRRGRRRRNTGMVRSRGGDGGCLSVSVEEGKAGALSHGSRIRQGEEKRQGREGAGVNERPMGGRRRKGKKGRAEVATPELFPSVAVQTVTADGRRNNVIKTRFSSKSNGGGEHGDATEKGRAENCLGPKNSQ